MKYRMIAGPCFKIPCILHYKQIYFVFNDKLWNSVQITGSSLGTYVNFCNFCRIKFCKYHVLMYDILNKSVSSVWWKTVRPELCNFSQTVNYCVLGWRAKVSPKSWVVFPAWCKNSYACYKTWENLFVLGRFVKVVFKDPNEFFVLCVNWEG